MHLYGYNIQPLDESDQITYTPTFINSANEQTVHGWALMDSEYNTKSAPGVALRCDNDTSVAGYSGGISWNEAKTKCLELGKDLPKTLADVGEACGSGHGYDTRLIWMHENFDGFSWQRK